MFRAVIGVLLLVLICLLALGAATGRRTLYRKADYVERAEAGFSAADFIAPLILAGGERARAAARQKAEILRSPNLVVDTLNLTHWLNRLAPKKIDLCAIIAAIDESAPLLRARYAGRIIYVTKSRETKTPAAAQKRARALYQLASRRNKVYINVVEKLADSDRRSATHAGLGRDDFYLSLLAWKLRCPVLSRDKFRDLKDMKKGALGKFRVYSYSPVRAHPAYEHVDPAAADFARLRVPVTVDYGDVLPPQN